MKPFPWRACGAASLLMLILPSAAAGDNPWCAKAPAALSKAQASRTAAAYFDALDVLWRADDWRGAVALADEARAALPQESKLWGAIARAYWRAGRIADAEAVAARIEPQTADATALRALVPIELGRGNRAAALACAERLENSGQPSALDLIYLLTARIANEQRGELGALVRMAQLINDPNNGYPETVLAEQFEGQVEFYQAIGSAKINRVAQYGAADLPVIPLINLPGCDVWINGRGPYRMVLDTGGSITLSIDTAIAEDLGIQSIASASVRGVAGKDTSGQALLDEVRIGGIVCRRVMTRIFGVRKAATVDGIIGTGLFADERFTLNFGKAELVVAASTDQPGPGAPVELRIIGDGKLVAPVQINGHVAAGLLDSGADVVAVAPTKLRKLHPDRAIESMPMAAMGVGADEPPGIVLAPGIDLKFAGRDFRNVGGLGLDVLDDVLGPMLGMQCDVLIGMGIFRQMKTFTVDQRRCRLWVEWVE